MGQLQLATELIESQFSQELAATLTRDGARVGEATTRLAEFTRYAATQWNIVIARETARKRVTLVIPKEPRDLGIAPAAGTSAVLFVTGQLVELWKAQDWVSHIRLIRERMDEFVQGASEEMADR